MRRREKEQKDKVSRLIIILSIIIMLVVTLYVFVAHMGYYAGKVIDDVTITIQNEVKRAEDKTKVDKISSDMLEYRGRYMLDYCSYYIEEKGSNITSLNALDSKVRVNLYYASETSEENIWRVYKTAQSDVFALNTDSINTLLQEGYLEQADAEGIMDYYRSRQVGDGYVIISYTEDDFIENGFEKAEAYSQRSGETVFWIDDEDVIISSNDKSCVGKVASEVLDLAIENTVGVAKFGDDYGYYNKSVLDGMNIVVFIPLMSLLSGIVRSSIVPIILFWVLLVAILIYVLIIRKNEYYKDDSAEKINIGNRITLNKKILSHITALAFFGLILIGISLFYVSTLISYSDQNVSAARNLKALSVTYEANQKNKETLENNLNNEFTEYADIASWGLIGNTNEINDTYLQAMVSSIEYFSNIKITDGNATIVASTTSEDGYTLGRNDNSINSICWQIMDGQIDDGIYLKDSPDYNGYDITVLTRRQDAKGVVIIEIAVDYIPDLMDIWNLEETMLTTDLGDATTYAVYQDEPGKVYMSTPDAEEVEYIDTTLNDKILVNGFNGIQRIKGVRYYINTLVNADYNLVLISALPMRDIPYSMAWLSLWTITIGIVVFVIVVLLGTAKINLKNKKIAEGDEATSEDTTSNIIHDYDNVLNEGFKNVVNRMILASGVVLVLLLVIDYLVQEKPLLSYLLGSHWNKGINLFSITMILLIIVGCAVTAVVIDRLTKMIMNNMGPRGMTIGHLMSSLIRFLLLIIAIIWSLNELGANLSALLAGAGIAGAAISFCASSTIGDLLSGFFIVFEGSFQIGDWIEVGGFRGQVQKIGMRTTQIAKGDCIKIINNAAMTNVTVMDPTNSGALARIDIAYKEDAEQVIKLIDANRKMFRDAIPEIEDGPYVKGVVDLGTNGVTIELYAHGSQSNAGKIERGIRLVAKKLFDENNIEIPFNQVTIHQADD